MSRRRLSLFASVPDRTHDQTIAVCSSLLDVQPQPFTQHIESWRDAKNERRAANWWRISCSCDASSHNLPEKPSWVLETIDMPEFGVKDVVSRGVHHCPIREGDILALAKELGYTKGYEHQERGHHLTRRNLKIAVYQVYAHPPSAAAEFVTVGRADTWIVQADIDVAQGNNPAEVQRATQDLLRLQNDLSSYIDLRTVRDELR